MAFLSEWLKFKVRTLTTAGLDDAAAALALKAQSLNPEVIIGIRSGGYVVAELMAKHFPQARLFAITCQRPSTKKKQSISLIGHILRALPHGINNQLRIVEHIMLTQLRAPQRNVVLPDPGELDAIENYLRGHKTSHILIVDDAVDSGATLEAVHKAVSTVADADATIKIAAVTVTTHTPRIMPDFFLYRFVLCRFPWSLDAKE